MPRPILIPVIAGPTAGGKSDLAVDVAIALGNAEVITADAFQVFRGLDIGTAKPTIEERRGIPHHLIDVVGPRDRFSVADWLNLAERAVIDIRARVRTPIIVGGTHLYIKAFMEGLFDGPAPDPELRAALSARPLAELRAELERVDPKAAARIHPNDARRTIRALEVFHQTGRGISDHQKQWDTPSGTGFQPVSDRILIGLDWPAELLNPRINARVKSMIDRGLVEEARALWKSEAFGGGAPLRGVPGSPPNQSREALGYKQLIEHFGGRCTLEEAIEKIKIETRRFAKNQRTWLKRLRPTPGSIWIDAESTPREEWCPIVLRVLEQAARA
ncbi:MAG: tRNA (adenosine(37)-N6)-dimethylallyltransferase MiaA [Phycisphaerales bacterium]|nr:tRNA (adenosine(37)-N6)-dimethylallyltransferase MiaA [Phycisphaerales bacterium]